MQQQKRNPRLDLTWFGVKIFLLHEVFNTENLYAVVKMEKKFTVGTRRFSTSLYCLFVTQKLNVSTNKNENRECLQEILH